MRRWRWSDSFVLVLTAVAAMTYVGAVQQLQLHMPKPREDALRVVLPGVVQTMMVGGDAHLAANVGTFRAVTLTTDTVDANTVHVLGKIQVEAARLNPLSEDNYYVAQAILPWQGEVLPTIEIMKRATAARTWDYLPAFFWGFDEYFFRQNNLDANRILLNYAEPRSNEINRRSMRAIASKWYERSSDPLQARAFLLGLREQSKDPKLKRLIQARITRVEGLIALRQASLAFRQKFGHPPARLQQLVEDGFVQKIPEDPFHFGYQLNAAGEPELKYQFAR